MIIIITVTRNDLSIYPLEKIENISGTIKSTMLKINVSGR